MDDRPDKTSTPASHAMEKEAEFPAPLDPPIVDVSVTSDETVESPQVATVVAKTTRPRLPVIFYRLTPKPRLKAVEQYIASFEYSLHPQTNFNSQKQRPLSLIMDTARMIIASPQPIKCVEAVFVALFLTAGLPDVERYPLSFQTVLDDQVYQHIVLVVQHLGKFGAIGISRWPEFCSKDLKFRRMSSVIENYKTAYEEQHHVVEKIRVGLPVEHNTRSTNFVCWRHLELDLRENAWRDCVEAIDEFAAKGKQLWNTWVRSRRGEDPRHLSTSQTKRMHADRESSPCKTKSLHSTVQLTTDDFDNSESMDTKIVNCRFNIQPPSSRDSARITLSLEPGEASYFWKKAPQSVLPKEFCFDKSPVAVRLPSKHGFTKFRRSKKAFKSGGDAAVQPMESDRGALRSLPRAAQSQSNEAPLAVSQCVVGTKYLSATPGFDGPKSCWECLRTLYRTKNEARLLLLKDKLADLQTQGPSEMESFRAVQDIFQQLVGIGEAITSRLHGFEETMNALSANVDVVVESVNNQQELQALKQLSKQLAEESLTEDQQPMINFRTINFQNKKGVRERSSPAVGKSRSSSPSLKKMGCDAETHVLNPKPPCNWCGLRGHGMRECQDLEIEIARRVCESKLRISCVSLPERSSHGELKEQESTEESMVPSVEEPYGKHQLHNNQDTELVPSQVQEQTGDSSAQPVAGKELEVLPSGEDQHTTAKEKRGSKMSRKKALVQRRLRTKLMYLLGK